MSSSSATPREYPYSLETLMRVAAIIEEIGAEAAADCFTCKHVSAADAKRNQGGEFDPSCTRLQLCFEHMGNTYTITRRVWVPIPGKTTQRPVDVFDVAGIIYEVATGRRCDKKNKEGKVPLKAVDSAPTMKIGILANPQDVIENYNVEKSYAQANFVDNMRYMYRIFTSLEFALRDGALHRRMQTRAATDVANAASSCANGTEERDVVDMKLANLRNEMHPHAGSPFYKSAPSEKNPDGRYNMTIGLPIVDANGSHLETCTKTPNATFAFKISNLTTSAVLASGTQRVLAWNENFPKYPIMHCRVAVDSLISKHNINPLRMKMFNEMRIAAPNANTYDDGELGDMPAPANIDDGNNGNLAGMPTTVSASGAPMPTNNSVAPGVDNDDSW